MNKHRDIWIKYEDIWIKHGDIRIKLLGFMNKTCDIPINMHIYDIYKHEVYE